MIIEITDGITWQKAPSARNIAQPGHDNWVVDGDQRIEVPGTAGWRSRKKTVCLQHDGSWAEQFHGFPSKEAAETALAAALGKKYEPAPVSAFATALLKAQKK